MQIQRIPRIIDYRWGNGPPALAIEQARVAFGSHGHRLTGPLQLTGESSGRPKLKDVLSSLCGVDPSLLLAVSSRTLGEHLRQRRATLEAMSYSEEVRREVRPRITESPVQ